MGNAFVTLYEKYTTNVKNNIIVWSYSRIKTFFALRRYEMNLLGHSITDIDVKNATKATAFTMFNNIVPTDNVNRLLEHARVIGIPNGQNFCEFVRRSCFQTIPIFLHIQRQVFNHHQRYEMLNAVWQRYYRDPANHAMPTIARPPKIRNFRVIPVHDFKTNTIHIFSIGQRAIAFEQLHHTPSKNVRSRHASVHTTQMHTFTTRQIHRRVPCK